MPKRNPLFPLGVTVHPFEAEGGGADGWYARDLASEIALVADAGATLVRLLVSWRALEPQVGQYDAGALERLADVVEQVRAASLRAIVCFFADDPSADLSQVPWSQKRDVRTDAYLLQRQVELVGQVVQRLQSAKGVFAWQLGDEAFCQGFETADAFGAWAEALRQAVREQDSQRPVIVGADAETLFRSAGFDAHATLASGDIRLAHATAAYRNYLADGPPTSITSSYIESFLLRLAMGDRKVIVDEVGPSSHECSLAEEAAALRVSVWSALANRARGVLLRRVVDLQTDRREPYYVDRFESLVGLADTAGTPKPAYDALKTAIAAIAHIDLDAHQHVVERVAVVLPAERFAPLPSLGRLFAARSALQAFAAAKRAHLPVTVVRETDDLSPYRALLVPSPFGLDGSTWERLSGFVSTGGSLVFSYGGGEFDSQVRDLLGVDFLGDDGPASQLTCRVAQQDVVGELEAFDALLEVPCFALVSPTSATVVATDATGNPLLTSNRVGNGTVTFLAAPLERALARADQLVQPSAVLKLLSEVYAAAARAAGYEPPVTCDEPGVEIALLQGDESDVLVLVNHANERRATRVTFARLVAHVTDVRGGMSVEVGAPAFDVVVEASDAVALTVTYRA